MQYLKLFESFDDGTSHEERFNKLIKSGFNIDYIFYDKKRTPTKEEAAMQNLFPKIREILTPRLSNCCAYDQNNNIFFYDHDKDVKKMKKSDQYTVRPLPTIGRYTIDSSKQYVIKDLAKAKEVFKGRNNYAWGFGFADGSTVDIIISKAGKLFTLVQEDKKCMLPKLFVKLDDFYLKEGWVKEDRLLEILFQMYDTMSALYKSKKLLQTNAVTGVFEHLNMIENEFEKLAKSSVEYFQTDKNIDIDVRFFEDLIFSIGDVEKHEKLLKKILRKHNLDLESYDDEGIAIEKLKPWKVSQTLIDTNDKTGVFENRYPLDRELKDYNFIQLVPNERSDCFILEGHIDKDTYITYGIYLLNHPKAGEEWMEYYTGSNYKVGSTATSFSRHFKEEKIPKKWKPVWLNLKEIAKRDYPMYFSEKLLNTTKKTGVFDLPF